MGSGGAALIGVASGVNTLLVDLPDGLISTIHAADRRIPVEVVTAGTNVIYTALQHFGG